MAVQALLVGDVISNLRRRLRGTGLEIGTVPKYGYYMRGEWQFRFASPRRGDAEREPLLHRNPIVPPPPWPGA